MRNITLSMDEKLLEEGRRYAREHNTTLNSLMRELLAKKVTRHSGNRLEETFRKADDAHLSSKGKKWNRESLYDV